MISDLYIFPLSGAVHVCCLDVASNLGDAKCHFANYTRDAPFFILLSLFLPHP